MSIQVALAGNPNCGKTTLFNGLTGLGSLLRKKKENIRPIKRLRLRTYREFILYPLIRWKKLFRVSFC